MAARAAAGAIKAIYAEPAFLPKGTLTGGRFNLIREIAIGTSLGIAGAFMWKVRRLDNCFAVRHTWLGRSRPGCCSLS